MIEFNCARTVTVWLSGLYPAAHADVIAGWDFNDGDLIVAPSVPEPAMFSLLGIGLADFLLTRRRVEHQAAG